MRAYNLCARVKNVKGDVMADYEKTRARRRTSPQVPSNKTGSVKINKKTVKKLKKSPVAILVALFLIIGFAAGYFVSQKAVYFTFNDYAVNGVASEEKDYVVIDLSGIKEKLTAESASPVTYEEIAGAVVLSDGGCEISFFGKDLKSTLSTRVLYREDISHDCAVVQKIDLTVPGTYYVEYSSSHFAFKNANLIRTIVVTGVEIDG